MSNNLSVEDRAKVMATWNSEAFAKIVAKQCPKDQEGWNVLKEYQNVLDQTINNLEKEKVELQEQVKELEAQLGRCLAENMMYHKRNVLNLDD